MITRPGLLLLAVLGLGAPALAQHEHHAPAAHDMAAMNEAMMRELRPLSGAALEVAYLKRMIDHHAMALDMARVQLARGKSPTVTRLAQTVLDTQAREIEAMQAMLRARGAAYRPVSMPVRGPDLRLGHYAADVWFLQEMIPHHQGAIDMSLLLPGRTDNAELLRMAAEIVRVQRAEIAQYQALLRRAP